MTIPEPVKKDLKLVGYLLISGVLGYVLAEHVAKDPALTVVLAPAINYVLYRITKELENDGYIKTIRDAIK